MIIKYFSKEQIKINAPRVIHKDLFKKCPISIIQHHISGTEGTAPFHPLFAIVDTPGFQGNAIFFFFFTCSEAAYSLKGGTRSHYLVAQYLVPTLITRVITEVNLDQ